MKKIILISIFIGVFFLINRAVPAQQTNRWQFISRNDNGSISYLENSGQKQSGSKRQAWTKEVYRDRSYKIILVEWQCRAKKFRVLEGTSYAPNGEYINREGSSDWLTVIPDSVSENYFKVVCAGESLGDESIASGEKQIVEVTAENANVREAQFPVSPVIQRVAKGARLVLADAEPVGGWYQVFLPGTKKVGWLSGRTIKILKTASGSDQPNRKLKRAGKRKTAKSN